MIKLSLNVILEMAASFERPKSPFEKEGQEVDVYTIDTSCPHPKRFSINETSYSLLLMSLLVSTGNIRITGNSVPAIF